MRRTPLPPVELPNGDPVLVTRLEPPLAPAAFLRRDRLVRRLDEAVRLPVTLVNGPAGAGKTLLVADWTEHGRPPGRPAWLTVEASDDSPGCFWSYVLAALRHAGQPLPARIGAPADADRVEPSLLLRLADWIGGRDEPVVLVLDEFEQITDPRPAEQLHELVRHTRGRLRLVLVGRTEPLLPLHRYRAEGRLGEIRAADLAMRLPEAEGVLRRHGLDLGPDTVAAVHERVAGWSAGLRLLALAAQHADDPDTYLKQIGAEHTGVPDFLLAEVLRTQPAHTQDLLLRTSLFPRLHPGLADALTGRQDGGRILAGLHRANAFVDLLPGGWYRLHPLFAETLRLHLHAADPGLPEELHRRAAHWFDEDGQQRAALEHAVAGGAWDFAARLLIDQLAVGELSAGPSAGRLRALFSRMPPTAHTPDAELVRAAVRLSDEDVAAGVRALDRAEPRLSPEDTTARITAAGLRAGAGRLLGSAELAGGAARRAHRLGRSAPAGPLHRHPELLGQADADLGSALLWEGRFDEAGEALAAAAAAPATATTARLRHDSQCRLALIDYLRGRPGRAERRVRRADEEADRCGLPAEARTDLGDVVLAGAALEHDDVAAARDALRHAEPSGDPVLAVGLGLVHADLRLAQGDPDAALSELERTRRLDLAEHPSPWCAERIAVAACAAHLAAGRVEAAVDAVAEVPGGAPDSVLASCSARLAAGHDADDALSRLDLLRTDAAIGSTTRTRALLLLARAGAAHTDAAGPQLLAQALRAAEPERLRRPFRECGPWVRHQLLRHPGLAEAHPWLPDDLLPPAGPARTRRQAVGEAAPGPAGPVDPLTERERDVLARVGRMMSTQEIADDLFLSPNTVKTHLKSINRKLATTTRREALRTAARMHLLDEE
ncbi:LuxR C-terminal-related transcriptional regulator [Kitasatospora sp. NPDC051705]|uniref:LuxR C-terminal-related transcriptional regulator n=1 Tax=Kitasatospora sp. NPDC051705 TaxID=3364057 RepID=UPI0037AD98EA